MKTSKFNLEVLIVGLVAACLTGCGGQGSQSGERAAKGPRTGSTTGQPAVRATDEWRDVAAASEQSAEVFEPQGPRLALPPIHLSAQHQATCLVKQGDTLPNFQLQDPEGKSHTLHSLFGDRFTVVCFWSGELPAAVQQLQDTGPEIIDVFSDQGLAVVSINFGQSANEVRRVTQQTGFTAPVLLDPNGAALARVATRYLPRTYLLDSEGKVVWFDQEYSPSTRRHLKQAIEYSLAQP
jgi:peroxiredoxin